MNIRVETRVDWCRSSKVLAPSIHGQKGGRRAAIVDDIEYRTALFFFDLLFYLALLVQFLLRKPVYRRVFA